MIVCVSSCFTSRTCTLKTKGSPATPASRPAENAVGTETAVVDGADAAPSRTVMANGEPSMSTSFAVTETSYSPVTHSAYSIG